MSYEAVMQDGYQAEGTLYSILCQAPTATSWTPVDAPRIYELIQEFSESLYRPAEEPALVVEIQDVLVI
jgi:hypothetical protein